MTNNEKKMKLMKNNENNCHYSRLNFMNCRYSKVSRGAYALLRFHSHYLSLFVIVFLLESLFIIISVIYLV